MAEPALLLSEQEIQSLTGRRRTGAQARQLEFLGIEHRRRADGSLVILRSQVERALGAPEEQPAPANRRKTAPRFDLIK
ncbi:DUF4224 domain-containing protein [Niveibacterium sp. SC-1]|uniref:DUF4224 domain-containing protein n=1 Tax=Niveibacterium sp. SC-1 TaxID=3135646 RepID=UPI00311E9ABA